MANVTRYCCILAQQGRRGVGGERASEFVRLLRWEKERRKDGAAKGVSTPREIAGAGELRGRSKCDLAAGLIRKARVYYPWPLNCLQSQCHPKLVLELHVF